MENEKIKLLEVFKDIELFLEGKSQNSNYKTLMKVIPKLQTKKITLWHLRRYAKNLNEKYEDRHFYVKKVVIDNKVLYELNQITIQDRIEAINKEIISLIERYKELKNKYEEVKKEYDKINYKVNFYLKLPIFLRPFSYIILRKTKKKLLEIKEKEKEYRYSLAQITKKIVILKERRNKLKELYSKSNIEMIGKKFPIYFDLENQKVYVNEEDYKKEPKLSNYILFRTLGSLGISTVKYVKTLGKIENE